MNYEAAQSKFLEIHVPGTADVYIRRAEGAVGCCSSGSSPCYAEKWKGRMPCFCWKCKKYDFVPPFEPDDFEVVPFNKTPLKV
jgi:hypothetical protein